MTLESKTRWKLRATPTVRRDGGDALSYDFRIAQPRKIQGIARHSSTESCKCSSYSLTLCTSQGRSGQVRDQLQRDAVDSYEDEAPPSLRDPKVGCIHNVVPNGITQAPEPADNFREPPVPYELRHVLHHDSLRFELLDKVDDSVDQRISDVSPLSVLRAERRKRLARSASCQDCELALSKAKPAPEVLRT